MSLEHDEGARASALARTIVGTEGPSLKIAVVRHGKEAGTLASLLTRVHGVSKGSITQVGYTCSDDVISVLLRKKNPIVIIPESIINNRPCVFHLPENASQVVAFQFLDGEVATFPGTCDGATVQFPRGWFS
jgi:hypothetical protein